METVDTSKVNARRAFETNKDDKTKANKSRELILHVFDKFDFVAQGYSSLVLVGKLEIECRPTHTNSILSKKVTHS